MSKIFRDWGEASEKYDEIRYNVLNRDLSAANEAQTRFDVVDRIVREVLGWGHGQINVEEATSEARAGYVDYILRAGDETVIIEAKKAGAAFPSPTRKTQLKLSGSVLGGGEIGKAIVQAEAYARDKGANVVVVTNGLCWCYYSLRHRTSDSYATILFPIDNPEQAETLFDVLSEPSVEAGSLVRVTNEVPLPEYRLGSALQLADSRLDRNNIADHILPALERALYADALLADPEQLKKCFITTEARAKYDSALGIHLADPKAAIQEPARRVKSGQEHGPLDQILAAPAGAPYAPPLTLIIGSVGAGKSTYLKHFELVAGRDGLQEKRAHWIYVDFEAMGKAGDPRSFLYGQLLKYLQSDTPFGPLPYKDVVAPAYDSEIRAWARGPLAPIAAIKDEFNRKVSERISADYDKIEPYVDRVLGHLASSQLCVVVLDNIDLYEDENLETLVFGEGLALSRRLRCHVVVSLRDTTFVRHRTDSAFDAYELIKLWIDPPPLKSVIASRLTYSKKILEGRPARIAFPNGMVLNVPDLSVFFDIVQRSILSADAGDFVDAVADGNIRWGLTLVRNFMTSGHIQADRALKTYVQDGNHAYTFPFHEIYKGTMLGPWRHFREDRAESVNVFDARLGAKRLRLLRLMLLADLWFRAQSEQSLEVPVSGCVDLFSSMGASIDCVTSTLGFLHKHGLVHNQRAGGVTQDSVIVLSRSGAYYTKVLTRKFVYVEECMFDTAIEDSGVWQRLTDLTAAVEGERYPSARMEIRHERIRVFLDYLLAMEAEALALLPGAKHVPCLSEIQTAVLADASDAVRRAKRGEGADSRTRTPPG